MAKQDLLSPDLLRKLFAYDPETGVLTWAHRPVEMFKAGHFSAEHNAAKWNTRYAGKTAFTTLCSAGYPNGDVFGIRCKAHQIAWAVYYGEWPDGCIDHINRIRTDNRICNLRVVSIAENNKNRSRQTNNTSGVTGVVWNKKRGEWYARINVSGKSKHLGAFAKLDDAVRARELASAALGFHEKHGK